MTAEQAKAQLDRGTSRADVIHQLVATGNWSPSGAIEIVRFLTHGPDRLLAVHEKLPRTPRRARTTEKFARLAS